MSHKDKDPYEPIQDFMCHDKGLWTLLTLGSKFS